MDKPEIRVLLAHDVALSPSWVADHIPHDSGIAITAVVDSLSTDSEAVRSSDADMLVVACGRDDDDALQLVAWWSDSRQGQPVVMLCPSSNNGFVQRALGAGADDLVVVDDSDIGMVSEASARQVGFAIEKAAARKRAPAAPADNGTAQRTSNGAMICVLGPKGGIGKTVTCSNVAAALAGFGQRVVLMDLDVQFGDIALALGLRPENTIFDLAVSGGSLDAAKIDAYLTRHETGLQVLAAPLRPDQAEAITPEFIVQVAGVLRDMFDFVIVDTPPAFTPEVIAAVDASSHVCMVGMLDALSLKNTRLGLETLELMGYPPERIRIVLNRANTAVGITGTDVDRVLGRSPDIFVPSHRDVARSVNAGEPIVLGQKRSDAARAFEALAQSFMPRDETAKRRRRGLFRRRRTG